MCLVKAYTIILIKLHDINTYLIGNNCKDTELVNNTIFHISQNLVNKLDEFKFFDRNIQDVIVENQPSLKNPTMKSIQMIVYSYFLINGLCNKESSITGLDMINARNKLKVYKGEPIECDFTDRYKKNKYLAVKYCEKMIINDKEEFIDLYNIDSYILCLMGNFMGDKYFFNFYYYYILLINFSCTIYFYKRW